MNHIYEIDQYEDEADLETHFILYHGTSLYQLRFHKWNWFSVQNLHLSDDHYVAEHHAEERAMKDHSVPVLFVLDAEKMSGELLEDPHEDDNIVRYYLFSGNFIYAILSVINLETGEDICLDSFPVI